MKLKDTEDLWDETIECSKCCKEFISYDTNWVLLPPKVQMLYTEVMCPYCDYYDMILFKKTKNKVKNESIKGNF